MSLRYLPNSVAELYIQDGILFCIYQKKLVLHLSAAQWVVSQRLALQMNRVMPVYCDHSGVRLANKDVRDYMALEGTAGISALALVVSSPVSQVISEVFTLSNLPPIPTQIFMESSEALAFLKQYL